MIPQRKDDLIYKAKKDREISRANEDFESINKLSIETKRFIQDLRIFLTKDPKIEGLMISLINRDFFFELLTISKNKYQYNGQQNIYMDLINCLKQPTRYIFTENREISDVFLYMSSYKVRQVIDYSENRPDRTFIMTRM